LASEAGSRWPGLIAIPMQRRVVERIERVIVPEGVDDSARREIGKVTEQLVADRAAGEGSDECHATPPQLVGINIVLTSACRVGRRSPSRRLSESYAKRYRITDPQNRPVRQRTGGPFYLNAVRLDTAAALPNRSRESRLHRAAASP